MRRLILAFSLTLTASCFAQHETMLWTELGAEGKIAKGFKWGAEINTRIGRTGVETFFPQVGAEAKITKWLKGSVEYRFILDKNKYGNYKSSNRLNLNLAFKEGVERFDFGVRLRYQYAFNRLSQESYDADFDQAIRLKPSIEYDIDNSIFTPEVSAEFFYNPNYGELSPGFSKMRIAAGVNLELDGPHSVSVKYQLDKKFRDYSANLRHVISIGYGYKF